MSKNLKIIFSFIILFIGIFIFASEYLESKKIAVYDYMNELYYNEEITVEITNKLEDFRPYEDKNIKDNLFKIQ